MPQFLTTPLSICFLATMSIVNTKDQATIPPAEDKKLLEEVTEEQEQKMAEAKGSKEIGNRGSRCVWATSVR